MEFRLCATPLNGGEHQNCFNQNLLQRTDGQGSRIIVDRGPATYSGNFRLPANVRCARCVLQWNYRAGNNFNLIFCFNVWVLLNVVISGNNWGNCPDGSQGKKQENFKLRNNSNSLFFGKHFRIGMWTTRKFPWMRRYCHHISTILFDSCTLLLNFINGRVSSRNILAFRCIEFFFLSQLFAPNMTVTTITLCLYIFYCYSLLSLYSLFSSSVRLQTPHQNEH